MTTCECDDGTPATDHSALGTLIDSTQRTAADKQAFNTRITRARTLFFESPDGTVEHASAERELAALRQEKDLILALPLITAGFSENAQTPIKLFDLLSGGELDNGIPAEAAQAFRSWVIAMRQSLGAQGNNDMLAITDNNSFQQALAANSARYATYQMQRDTAERSAFEAQQKYLNELETARTQVAADGGVPLRDQRVRPLASYDYRQGDMSAALDKALMEMFRHDPSVLECNYGPGLGPQGTPVYYQFVYWHQQLPTNLAEVLQADTHRLFENLGNQAKTECPLSNLAALAVRTALVRTHPWYSTPTPSPTREPTDQRLEQRLSLEQKAQEKRCTAYAERLEKARVKASSSVGAARAYTNMQATYSQQCSPQ